MEKLSKKITGEVMITSQVLAETQKEIKNISDYEKKIGAILESRVTEILEIILAGAIQLDVSDVHLEPKDKDAKIRVRVDGLLQNVLAFNTKIYQSLLSRIKLVSGLKLNITDRPQDGRFSISLPKSGESKEKEPGYYAIEIRTSSLPTEYGETIVLRILNPKSLIDVEAYGSFGTGDIWIACR